MRVGETKLEELDLIERRGRINGEPARLFVRVMKPQGYPCGNRTPGPDETSGDSEYILEEVDTERGEGPSEEIEMGK